MDNALRAQDWAQACLDRGSVISFPDTWSPEERTVSGSFISKAILGAQSEEAGSQFGLENGVILGGLELQSAEVLPELWFQKCHFAGPVSMREVTFAHRVRFTECVFQNEVTLGACRTSDLWFATDLELSEATPKQPGAVFEGPVRFIDSRIAGNLCLDNASFNSDQPNSFNGAVVDGSVLIRCANFRGAADFIAIRVGYSLSASGCHFHNTDEPADFSTARITHSLSLSDAVFEGPAAFANTDVGTNFVCTRTKFMSREKSISFNSLTVNGHALFDDAVFSSDAGLADFSAARIVNSLSLSGVVFECPVTFTNAEVGTNFVCARTKFMNREKPTSFNAITVKGHALFEEAVFNSQGDFVAAKVFGSLTLTKAEFCASEVSATFNSAEVAGHAIFTETIFHGSVDFGVMKVSGMFDFRKARFLGAEGLVDLSIVTVKGAATFEEAVFHGSVSLAFAEIDGLVSFQSTQFLSDKAVVNLQAMRARNIVWLADAKFHGPIRLALAEIGGSLRCDRTEFLNPTLALEANAFKVKGHASFADAKFYGSCDFCFIEVDGQLVCDRAEFLNPTAVVAFDSCIVRGAAEFSKTIFHGPTRFTAIRIAGHANFNFADFRNQTDFNSARIENWALFNNAHFAAVADFPYLNIGAEAEFSGAVFRGPVKFTSSRIGGNFRCTSFSSDKGLSTTTFEQLLDLTGTSVGGEAIFDGIVCKGTAVFNRMSIRGSAGFNRSKFHGEAKFEQFSAVDAYFMLAHFEQSTNFTGFSLKGSGYFTGAKFTASTSFRNGMVEGDLKFDAAAGDLSTGDIPVAFGGPANADGLHVKGELTFSGCSFAATAELTLHQATIGTFNCQNNQFGRIECFSAEISMGLLFLDNVVGGDAGFSCLKVNGRAVFNGTIFKQVFDLREAVLAGGSYFNLGSAKPSLTPTPCTFEGVAGFDSSRFSGPVEFRGTVFRDKASFAATHFLGQFGIKGVKEEHSNISFGAATDFGHAVFVGPAWFVGIDFEGTARFSKAQFQDRVMFANVNFKDRSDDSAVFAEANFQSQAIFIKTTVAGRLTFYGARSQHTLGIWSSCRFNGSVDFENAKLSILKIEGDTPSPSDMSFLGRMKLSGCTYQRITCPDFGLDALWRTIYKGFDCKSGRRTSPDFDRQPYLQFERFCREVGKNELADTVYFELKRSEGEFESRRLQRFWGTFERRVFGYGVRPLRMVGWFLGALVAGALVLSFPVSVKAAPARFLMELGVSLGNLIPGLTSLFGGVTTGSGHRVAVAVGIFQRCFGWTLLALLAHRFFKGLKR